MKMNQVHLWKRIQIYYICMVFVFLCLCVVMTGCGKEIVVPSYDEEVEPPKEVSMFAIVSNLDEVNEKITLKAVDYKTEIVLSYNGGVDVQDKYGDILSISQVELGSIVDIVYDESRDKLISLYLSNSDNLQVLNEISGAEIDYVEQTMRISGKTYRLGENATAFSDNTEIGLDELCSEDRLKVWLYNDIVCSIFVELGHGYVRLWDYASYLGGMVEIGYDVIVPVTEDMLLTVREGEYTLRIAKGNDVGTKNIKVVKNQEVDISLADLAIEPKQMGSVLFKVTPSDAAVYIDGRRVNIEGAVDIVYGKHKIYITADGYDTYSASFNVNYAYKIKEYILHKTGETTESSSTEKKTTQNSETTEKNSSEQGTSGTSSTEKSTDDVKDVNPATGQKTSNKVTITAPIGASVYFDGEYIGIAPMSFTKVTGSHIITLSQTGYLSKSYTVTFTDDGKDERLTYNSLDLISSLIE